MPGATTRYGLPYQSAGDAPDGPNLGKNLADAAEGVIGTVDDRLLVAESKILAADGTPTGKPLVRLTQVSAAQAIAHNVDVTLLWNTEDIDTHNFHNNVSNTSRITPNVPGYYQINCVVHLIARTDYSMINAHFMKNGVVLPSRVREYGSGTNGSRTVPLGSIIVTANGSTDYFEVQTLQSNGSSASTNTQSGGSGFSSIFECTFLRPL